jgi:hypothetical protein
MRAPFAPHRAAPSESPRQPWLSYTLDPRRRSVASSISAIEKKAGSGTRLSVRRVVDGGALR